ncbi:MAG: 2-oxoglutarate synthase [bacterium]|nr:2-oxoglutarate synthase [bacterium]MCP4966359.1 2-oxoglutarate synthase [bacterium]
MSTPIELLPNPTLRTEDDYPFCPGCGHGPVLDALNSALVRLELEPHEVVIVSDIGCSGLSDQFFTTSAFHGLHGRSITYATGIKLARPDLEVVVIMGDGGTGIGGAHLLSAARRNIGITVLVLNNFNFGMTGGQHSTTTPEGFITPTTPSGNLEHPLDICATVGVNGAAYAYRGTSFDDDLVDRIVEGIEVDGLSMMDVWDLCTAYFVRNNKFSRRQIDQTMEVLGLESGVLYRSDKPEFTTAYRRLAEGQHEGLRVKSVVATTGSTLEKRRHFVVAGSAGGRVRSAARLVALAAMRSGLWAAQRDDYPITVKSGHSVSEVIISPEEIHYNGIDKPDVVVIVSDDGVGKAGPYLEAMEVTDTVYVVAGLVLPATAAKVIVLDAAASETRIPKASLALALVSHAVDRSEIVPFDLFEATAGEGGFGEKNLELLAAGVALTEA